MGLRVPWIEYSLHIVQVRKLRPKQVGPAPLGMKPVRSHRAPLLEGLILSECSAVAVLKFLIIF